MSGARIFVYGTLMRGGHNHRVMGERARLVRARARTLARFTMLDLGSFPAIVDRGNTAIVGEVFELNKDALKDVDRLEGHPTFYRRTQVALADGELVETYLWQRIAEPWRSMVISGDWRQHIAARMEAT